MDDTPINDSTRTLEDELLVLLASQARKVLIPVFVVSAMIAGLAAPYIPAYQWIGWLVAVFLILLARRIVIPMLAENASVDRRTRLLVIVVLSFLHGCAQGYSLTFFPHIGVLQQSMQTMLLAGLCMGAVATSGGYLPFFAAFVAPIMGPLIVVWLTSVGGSGQLELDVSVALATALFLAVLISVSTDTYRQFRKSYDDRRKLRDAINSKTRFLATASHDLRQPMQALSASIESLSGHDLDAEASAIVQDLHLAKEDLSGLLRALLDISRLDAGVEDLEERDFNLYRLLFAVVDEFTPAATDKGLALEFNCPEEANARTNPMQLKRIVSNLVENAVRYTEAGQVRISCVPKGRRWLIEVSDTGIGIATQDVESIFEDFRQLGSEGRSYKRTGLGLGLSIVRRLIKQLELELEVRSEPGVGSVFAVVVPQARSQPSVAHNAVDTTFEFSGLQVVVVDDEEDVARALRKMLQSVGCEVRVADGTASALDLIAQMPPEVLLVDRRLKDGDDGLLLIEKARDRVPGMPSVLISGDTAPHRIKEAESAGIPALVKPAGLEEIKRAIAVACGQRVAG